MVSSLGPNIHITGLTQPDEPGAVMAVRCPECGVTEIVWNSWAIKPKDGDMWVVTLECPAHIKSLWLSWPKTPAYDFQFTGWHS